MDAHSYEKRVCSITIHFGALTEHVVSRNMAAEQELHVCLKYCIDYLRSWPAPPNWSDSGWRAEAMQSVLAAAYQAAGDFDPERGTAFVTFLRSRIISRSLTKYRKEWNYGRRLQPEICEDLEGDGEERAQPSRPAPLTRAVSELEQDSRSAALGEALACLPEAHRKVVRQVFWEELTQQEIAVQNGVSQRAISKKQQAALKLLRKHFKTRGGADEPQ